MSVGRSVNDPVGVKILLLAIFQSGGPQHQKRGFQGLVVSEAGVGVCDVTTPSY